MRTVRFRKAVDGFAMVEVLIAVFVLAIGILGAGAMQTIGLQANRGAALRSQAMFLAADMMDRIRANRSAIGSYVEKDTNNASVQSLTKPSCVATTNGCSPANVAQADIVDWVDSIERDNLLPNGQGLIERGDGDDIRITIRWGEVSWSGSVRDNVTMSYDIVASINPMTN